MRRRPLKVDRRFGGTRQLHLQGRKICETGNQHGAGRKKCSAGFASSVLGDEDVSGMFLTKVGLLSNGLHGVRSDKIQFFITTYVKTSNPTKTHLSLTFSIWYS